MEPVKQRVKVTFEYEMEIDPETGEILSNKLVDTTRVGTDPSVKKATRKPKKGERSEPVLTLEDNKYCLNTAAVELMGVEPDCKLDIKYDKNGKTTIPVIGTDEAFGTKQGNKLTKSFTVACRGSKNEELAKYGKEFILVPHESKDGIFVLTSEDAVIEQAFDDDVENIDLPSEEIELPGDIDLQDLIDNEDAKITEVNSSMFQL